MKYTKEQAKHYRENDDKYCPAREHFGAEIKRQSANLMPEAVALDLGCGTGRYFHCVQNAKYLIGVDTSAEMISQARQPLPGWTAKGIALVNKDINDFEPHVTIDFIYSIGVLAEHIYLTQELVDKFHSWLKPRGKVYFTAEKTKENKPQTIKREDLGNILRNSKFGAGRIAEFKTNADGFKGEHFEVWLTK